MEQRILAQHHGLGRERRALLLTPTELPRKSRSTEGVHRLWGGRQIAEFCPAKKPLGFERVLCSSAGFAHPRVTARCPSEKGGALQANLKLLLSRLLSVKKNIMPLMLVTP